MQGRRGTKPPPAATPHASRRVHEEGAGKLPELARCTRCEASYREGRWTWKRAPADAYEATCPACERIEKDYPAGLLRIGGGFAHEHRDEIEQLLRNVERRECETHPLKRILRIEDADEGFTFSTTDAKLVLALGRSLEQAYSGELSLPPTTRDTENLVRVGWTRD